MSELIESSPRFDRLERGDRSAAMAAAQAAARLGSPDAAPDHSPQPKSLWFDWLTFFGYVTASALAIAAALMVAVLLVSRDAAANPLSAARTAPDSVQRSDRPSQAHPVKTSATHGGALLMLGDRGATAAPLVHTDAEIIVTGTTARAKVKQRFRNASADWAEGVYLFPLPDDSAVDQLHMKVGERLIEGQIRERELARREYSRARANGQAAGLIEQDRPNVFTSKVANIAPGADVLIEITYQQAIALKDGVWSLRFPTVVAPRYDNGADDALRLAAPIVLPASLNDAAQSGPTVHVSVSIDAGVAVRPPRSATHPIHLTESSDGRYEVVIDRINPAERDFELEWAPSGDDLAQSALRVESHDGAHYALLVLTPPMAATPSEAPIARATTFIIDTSGSMHGASIEQARKALLFGLARLTPGDSFNVIEFNSAHRALFESPQLLSPDSYRDAIAFVESLRANGGTEMRGAIEHALSAAPRDDVLNQIVFLTDGAVSDEDDMLALIEQKIGRRRLFTIGIGSAPNSHFMRKAAEMGRGSFTYIGELNEVERKMARLFAKLSRPMLTDLSIRFDGAQPLEPVRLPGELYGGEPVIVRARFAQAPVGAVLSASRGNGAVFESRSRAIDAPNSGLHLLWARDTAERLGDQIRAGAARGQPTDGLRARVVELGLAHHLVTPYTSLVAVDVTATRPHGLPLHTEKVGLRLPHGWSHAAVFGADGQLSKTATPAALLVLLGAGLIMVGLATRQLTRRHNGALPRLPAAA